MMFNYILVVHMYGKIDENIQKLKEEVNKVHRGKPKEILMSHCTQMRLLTNF